jgi:hypothetical protein
MNDESTMRYPHYDSACSSVIAQQIAPQNIGLPNEFVVTVTQIGINMTAGLHFC